MPADEACRRLGELLTSTEARQVADRLAYGDSIARAVVPVAQLRRSEVARLLQTVPLDTATAALRAIETASVRTTSTTPVWTLPTGLAQQGLLHGTVRELLMGARESLTCATFNFQESSAVWSTLREVAARPGMSLRLYLDHDASRTGGRGTLSAAQIAQRFRRARVFESNRTAQGRRIRSHAKAIVVDHQVVRLGSANFSRSAEELNIELGLQVNDAALAQLIENQLRELEERAYTRVPAAPPS